EAECEHLVHPGTAHQRFHRHAQERGGIYDLHPGIDVIGRLDGTGGSERAVVARREACLEGHREERERENDDSDDHAAWTSPAYRMASCNRRGIMDTPYSAARTAAG